MSDPRTEAEGWFGEHEALWKDPLPRTPEGQHLWRLFMLGKLGPSPSGIRDFGQRICQIEAEAAAFAHDRPSGSGLDDEAVARLFHEAYERLAPSFGYETRETSAKPWPDVPENNRRLMTAVVAEVRAALSGSSDPEPVGLTFTAAQLHDAETAVAVHVGSLRARDVLYDVLAALTEAKPESPA